MGFMTELRYKRDDLNEKLKEAPWWVWAVIAAVLVLVMAIPITCSMREPPRVTAAQERIEEVRTQLTAAFNEIVSRLSQLPPTQRGGADLAAITSAIVSEKGADFFRCPVTGEAYRLNPDVRAWMINVAERPPAGVSAQDVLILTKASREQEKAGVLYVGMRARRMPANIKAGQEPAWMGEALVPAE